MAMARWVAVATLLAAMVATADAATETFVYPLNFIRVHGWLMWISMGLLMPVAIILVRHAKRARELGDLKTVRVVVYTHIFIQTIAVLLVIAAASLSVRKFDNTFGYTHERLGLALWILVWLAPLIGLVRPNHGGRSRPVWYAAHWLVGTGAVVLGFINIFIGMHVYELLSGKNLRTFNILFAIQLGVLGVIYLAQDRWQYLREQGTLSKMVTPVYTQHQHHATDPNPKANAGGVNTNNVNNNVPV